jgi:anaerobic selenocysteine-containing dehydrogenase
MFLIQKVDHRLKVEEVMINMKEPRIERRDFLKLSGSTAAITVLGNKLFGKTVPRAVKSVANMKGSGSKIVQSYCKMCIGPVCGMLVHVEDGVVTDIEGDPNHIGNEGKLCVRGFGSIPNLYNPYRVKSPMKRTNPEKGLDVDPGWVEITWEEALGTVTEKLGEILKEDPRGLIFHLGFGSMRDDSPMGRPVFPTAFGTPNETESNGPLCPVHFGALSNLGSFTYSLDPIRTNYIVCIGHSPGAEYAKASCADVLHGINSEALQNALDRGMKLVVVNPHAGAETVRGEWVPIIPGTELAFMLALGNVILHEIGKVDEWFLRVRTNAPYLIQSDGTYLREEGTNKPLLWDTVSQTAVPFDDPSVSGGSLADPTAGTAALTGSYTVNSVKVRTAFELIKDHFEPYTPEWAAELTDIPAETIRRIASELVENAQIGSTIEINGFKFPYRPAAVFAGRGAIAHRGGTNVMLAGNLLNGLLGATDVPGGLTGESFDPLPQPGPDGTVEPNPRLVPQTSEWVRKDFNIPVNHLDLTEFYPHRHCTPFVVWRSVVNPEKYYVDYEAKAMIVFGANPITQNVNMSEAIAAFKKIPFITEIAYHLDEPSQFADIILPESANLERLNYFEYQACGSVPGKRGMKGINFRYPVVGPIYDTRDANSILMELVTRLGINPPVNGMLNGMLGMMGTPQELIPPQPYTWEEVMDHFLKARFGEDKGIEYFKENGHNWTQSYFPEEQTYNYYYFPDGKTRHPIYNHHLLGTWLQMKERFDEFKVTPPGWDEEKYLAFFKPLPDWIPHPEHEAPEEYDLYAVNWKVASRAFGMGGLEELGLIREVQFKQSQEFNSVLINSKTAKEKGIQDGDEVLIESQYGGKQRGFAMISDQMHPKTLGFPGNFGRQAMFMGPEAKKGFNYNQLLSAADGEFDPVVGGIEITAAVKITKV